MNSPGRSRMTAPLQRKVALRQPWLPSLAGALDVAGRTGKPILELWLLGRLDEELSCANSRFFRQTLYTDPHVHAALTERFVLCWESFKPVPVVTVDFGDGRRLVRTLTGNSVHLVLDALGRPVDALPGIYRPRAFLAGLAWAEQLALQTRGLTDPQRRMCLSDAHMRAPLLPTRAPSAMAAPPSARTAGALASTKMLVEAPLLEGTRDLFESLEEDEHRNETSLHPQVHAMFASSSVTASARGFAHRIYDEVFLMPASDPWLGLRGENSGLWNDGVVPRTLTP